MPTRASETLGVRSSASEGVFSIENRIMVKPGQTSESSQPVDSSKNFQTSRMSYATQDTSAHGEGFRFAVVEARASALQSDLRLEKSEAVNGTVIQVDNGSAVCEIDAGNGDYRQIAIPLSLFPEKITVGFAFAISLDARSGFKRPRIEARQASAPAHVTAELQRLIDSVSESE